MKIKPFKLLIMPQTTTKNVQTKVRIFSYIVKTSISIYLGQFMQAFQCMKDKGIIFINSKLKKTSRTRLKELIFYPKKKLVIFT